MSQPSPKRRRRLSMILVILALIALVVLLFKPLILPAIARNVIERKLAQAGLPSAQFTLESVGSSSAKIRDFQLAPQSPHTISEIDVTYSLRGLLSGNLDSLTISRARWHINADPSAFSLNWPGAAPASAGVPTTFPFNLIHVADSSLVFHWSDKTLELPLNVMVSFTTHGSVDVTGETTLADLPLHIDLNYSADHSHLYATFLDFWNASVSPDIHAPSPRPAIPASLSVQIDRVASSSIWNASFNIVLPKDIRSIHVEPVDIGGVTLVSTLSYDTSASHLTDLSASALFSNIKIGNTSITALQCAATFLESNSIRLEGLASGPSWNMPTLMAIVPTQTSMENGERQLFSMDLEGDYTLPDELLTHLADAGFTHNGPLTLDATIFGSLIEKDAPDKPFAQRLQLRLESIDAQLSSPNFTFNRESLFATLQFQFLHASGVIDSEGLHIDIPAAPFATLVALQTPDLDLKASPQHPLASFDVTDESAHMSIPFNSVQHPQFLAPSITFIIADRNLHTPNLDITKVRASIPFNVSLDDSQLLVRLNKNSSIAVDRLQPLNSAGQPIDLFFNSPTQPLTFELRSDDDAPFLRIPFTADSTPHSSSASSLTLSKPIILGTSANRALATVTAAHLDWAASKSPSTPWSADSNLEITDAHLNDPVTGITLNQIALSMPSVFTQLSPENAGDQIESGLRIGEIKLGSTVFAPLTGKITRTADRISLTSRWPILENTFADTQLRADIAHADSAWQLSADATLDHAPPALLTQLLASYVSDLQLTGDCSAHAHLQLDSSNQSSSARITLNNVSAQSPANNLQLSALNADLNFTDLFNLRSAPNQTITAQSLAISDFTASNLQLSADLQSSSLVNISTFTTTLVDGSTLHSENATFNPRTGLLSADLLADGLRLSKWLPLLTHEHATGDGRISGSLSLTANITANPSFTFSRANFAADPSHGFVQVDDPAFIGKFLEQSNSQFAVNDEVGEIKNRIVAALGDFEFTEFHFTSSREQNQALSVLKVKGQGRQGGAGESSPVLNLSVDIPLGLDSLIRAAFSFQNVLDRNVNDQLNQFFDANE